MEGKVFHFGMKASRTSGLAHLQVDHTGLGRRNTIMVTTAEGLLPPHCPGSQKAKVFVYSKKGAARSLKPPAIRFPTSFCIWQTKK